MIFSLTAGALSFIVTWIIGQPLINYLKARSMGKEVNRYGPESHIVKAGTPTMGGLMIFATVMLAMAVAYVTAPLADRARGPSIFLPLGVMVVMGMIGFWDDLQTLQGSGRKGLSWRFKLGILFVLAVISAVLIQFAMDIHSVNIPGLGQYDIAYVYIPLAVIIIMATTSAVAITDGMDSLLGGTAAIAFSAYAIIAFLQEQTFLLTFCFSVVGANLGFLWYNAHPAQIFMGDTGALALGSSLAIVALMTGQWLLLPVIGGVFVLNALSDVIQIGYFKLTKGRRVFKMAPLHNHFELTGWSEPQVVMRFWLIGIVCAMIGIALALTV
ncbi:MAG: phospho-N-acetylmuramoyl-pentapeptide-transferase [Dehalococcoidia bacterium]